MKAGKTPRRRLNGAGHAISPANVPYVSSASNGSLRPVVDLFARRDVARPHDGCVLGVLTFLCVLHERDRRRHELVVGPVWLVTGREGVLPAAEHDVGLLERGDDRLA